MSTPKRSGIQLRPMDSKVFFAWLLLVLGAVGLLLHLVPGARSGDIMADVSYAFLAGLYWLEVVVEVVND